MQIVSLIVIGIGILIAYGGVVGIRSGKMQKVQFGSAIREAPPVIEGDAARRQGIYYIIAGIVLMAVGVVISSRNPAVLLSFVGLLSLVGAVYLAYVGWQGLQKRDAVFSLTVTSRSRANYVRSTRTVSHHYTGSAAVVVGIGYLLLAAGFIALGVILMFLPGLLVAGVVLGIIGFGLWVLSDVIAGRISATA